MRLELTLLTLSEPSRSGRCCPKPQSGVRNETARGRREEARIRPLHSVQAIPTLRDTSLSHDQGKKARLASRGEFAPAFPDCAAGAMPPFGNLYGVAVYVDRALGRNERIVFQAGTHTVTVSVAYADFERLARPTVADTAVTR
jgi:hypothetical protein